MEPIRLWRQERVDAGGVRYVRFVYSPYEGGSEWTTVDLPMVAVARAEYDALVRERDEERRIAGYYREACKIAGHDPLLDRFVDAVDSLWACIQAFEKPDDAYPEDTVSRLGYEARAATARADAASDRLARAEALLREAVRYVTPRDTSGDGGHAADIAARIDALLDAPTPDDRRGEDGAWRERGEE